MESQSETSQTVSALKLPVLKTGEYDLWSMRMEQYLTFTDHALWEVIVNGDSVSLVVSASAGAEGPIPPKTAEQKLARKNELKAKSTLMLAIPDEHLLKFHACKDAKSLWEAIKNRFGGNKESKKMQKTILKQNYENFAASSQEGLDKTYDRFQKLISQLEIHGEVISQEDANLKLLRSLPSAWNNIALIMRNKSDLDTLSMDDLYNNLKIDADDLEEIDLKWQVAMLTMRVKRFIKKTRRKLDLNDKETVVFDRAKVECYNYHRRGHFARECRAPRNQGNRNKDASRRNALVDTSTINVLVVQDGIGYQIGLESLEARIVIHGKNEAVYEENIEFLKYDVQVKDISIKDFKNQLEEALKEKDDLKLKLEKFEESSKNLTKLINSQISAKDKTGLGYDSQINESELNNIHKNESEVIHSVFNSRESDVDDNPINDRFKTEKPVLNNKGRVTGQRKIRPVWNNAQRVNHQNKLTRPHPKRNFVPTTVATKSGQVLVNAVKQSSPRAAASISTARPVNTAAPKPKVNDTLPTTYSYFHAHSPIKKPINKRTAVTNINFKKKLILLRPTRNVIDHISKDSGSYMLKRSDYVDLQGRLKIKGFTENKSFLTDYQEIDGGFVAFGGSPKGGKITGKGKIRTGKLEFEDTECLVLSPNFKLLDESQVLLKVPRHNNMYNFDLKNVVPSGGLTCLFAKATIDESNLCHRRLGHINFKTMNKLVRGNLVRGLPSKLFENNHTCVACQKGKQDKASCNTKLVSSISQTLQMLHMDLFGLTFVRSINHKIYCLVVTDDFSRFSWVFFLATKDETSGILKTFITGIENQINHKVKIIRCDNGTEFKNNDMNQFCGMKGIKREFSVARTPQQNRVAEAVNTACYVQNRVLVTKPHNKTPYELLHGRPPSISFMRPFGCPVTILNTLDPLGKFDGKADEGFLVGYSINSKAFRVFNTRTRKVEENLHITFLENKPNVSGSGPDWLFDIDLLTNSMNYESVTTGNQTNGNACIKDNVDAVPTQQYILLPLLSDTELDKLRVQQKEAYANSTNRVSTISQSVSAIRQSFINVNDLPTDPLMLDLEDTTDFLNTCIFSGAYDDEDVGAEVDLNN
ncbi:putative ribonuclease H-like domain-containing protein [Tanacetum coccineum]